MIIFCDINFLKRSWIRQNMTDQGILGDLPPSRKRVITSGILFLFLFSLIVSFPGVAAHPSRSAVIYIGSIEGDGDENETVLADYRWYPCNFTFFDWAENVETAEVSIDRGDGNEPLFTYDPMIDNLTVLDDSGMIEIAAPSVTYLPGGNTSLSFLVLVHLNWSFQTQVILRPGLTSNGSEIQLDSPQLMRFEVYGYLEPVRDEIKVLDYSEIEIKTGEAVLANSTISMEGLNFRYSDTSNRLSGFIPQLANLKPTVSFDSSIFNLSMNQGSFGGDIQVPDLESGSIQLAIDLPNVRSEWKLDLLAWSFALDIDGLGPRIEVTKPAPGKTQSGSEFIWNITVTDIPVSAGVNVNGSMVSYRVWTIDSNWTEWMSTIPLPDARSITYHGTAVGIPGSGSTMIQFRAMDELGNMNEIDPYPVTINRAPTLNISENLVNLEIFNNKSLELEGSMFASDPDGDNLDYRWYLDDSEPLSTLSNFRKPLFDIQPGEHTIKLEVSDGYEEVSESITFTVIEAPNEDKEDNWFQKLLNDENLFWYLLPVALIIILIPLIVLILFISRKSREKRSDDFIIDEERTMDMSQAEETAKKILETMSARESVDYDTTADAVTQDEGFDFDYDLYEVLGVEQTATEAEIKKKYRKLAAYFHPDRVAHHNEVTDEDAREEMVKINKAKEILLDAEIRPLYDAYISDMDFSMDMNDFSMDDGNFEDDWD
jgi:DnaJ-domain-containing protein 1